jgi:uncharacterized protein (DUF433 family)
MRSGNILRTASARTKGFATVLGQNGTCGQALNITQRFLSDVTTIVSDDTVRSGDPRIEDTRITVLDVKRRVIDAGESAHVVAGEYGIPVADLFHALAYYYDHRDEFREREREAATARREGERRTRSLFERDDHDAEPGKRAD